MASQYKTPPSLASQVHHVGLATLLRAASTPPQAGVSRTSLFLALKELASQPACAPPDGAFAQLLSQTVADLLLPGNEAKLDSVLRYHAIASQIQARRLALAIRRAPLHATQPIRGATLPTPSTFI